MSSFFQPIRRNLSFQLPKTRVQNWNARSKHLTQFFNTLSIFFPEGERFFIHSLRHYRDRIEDAQLQEDISAFIGQEAFHGREHEEYNRALKEAGLPIEALEREVIAVLELVKKLPKPMQLAATVSLEHLTAIMGDSLLNDADVLKEAEPHFRALWQWHAVEETEHKAVCFDAYEQTVGSGASAYAIRVVSFLLANAIFWTLFTRFFIKVGRAQGTLSDLKGLGQMLWIQWINPAPLRKLAPAWLDFLRPDFHPWDHDNRALLTIADDIVKQVNEWNGSSRSEGEVAA